MDFAQAAMWSYDGPRGPPRKYLRETALEQGCSELELSSSGAMELIRFLNSRQLAFLMKREGAAARFTLSSSLEKLFRWALQNLSVEAENDLKSFVGISKLDWRTEPATHNSEKERLEARLWTLECMAGDYELWARPKLSHWEEPGTQMVHLEALDLKVAKLRGGAIKYSCKGKPLTCIMAELEQQGHKVKQVSKSGSPVYINLVSTKAPAAKKQKTELDASADSSTKEGFTIVVTNRRRKDIACRVTPLIKVGSLLREIQAASSRGSENLSLVFKGEPLESRRALSSYNIEEGSRLELV